jgi:hypothetical protein
MAAKGPFEIPVGMRRVCRRFERWRKGHQARLPIPEPLNGANPFDYLTELQRHAEELKLRPSEWMPWNYRETLARLARPAAA